MSQIDFQRALRHERKRQKLNSKACWVCGLDDIRSLQSVTLTLCAECRLTLQGLTILEEHHVTGRDNDPFTVTLPANEHAIISDMEIEGRKMNGNGKFLIWLKAFKNILERLLELTNEGISTLEGEDG